MPLPRFAGNTSIPRRIVTGGNCRLLGVDDSIGAGLASVWDKCWNPPKRTGFIGGGNGPPNAAGRWGIATGGGDVSPFATSVDLDPVASTSGNLQAVRYTFNGGTSWDEGAVGGLAACFYRGPIIDAKRETQLFRQKVLTDAMSRGVDLTVKLHVYQESTGYDNKVYVGYSTMNAARKPVSPTFITCSGTGVALASITIPHTELAGMATTNGYIGVGIGLPNSTVTTSGKTVLVESQLWHWTSGEVGFEFGSVAVGGTTPAHWAATDGVYLDKQLQAICQDYGVTDFYIGLGANGGSALLAANLPLVVARLRRFVPGAGIIVASTWQTNDTDDSTWQNPTAEMYKINQFCYNWAAADGNAFFINVYDNYGPSGFSFAGRTNEPTSAGPYDDSLWDTNFGLTDGTHPTHNGFSAIRYGELTWGIMCEASRSAAPADVRLGTPIGSDTGLLIPQGTTTPAAVVKEITVRNAPTGLTLWCRITDGSGATIIEGNLPESPVGGAVYQKVWTFTVADTQTSLPCHYEVREGASAADFDTNTNKIRLARTAMWIIRGVACGEPILGVGRTINVTNRDITPIDN